MTEENFDKPISEFSDDDLNEIADLDRHRRYVDGAFWAQEGSPYTLATLWDE